MLKYMGVVFGVLCLLSLPSLVLNVRSNPVTAGNAKELFSLLSLGNIGSTRLSCNTGTYTSPITENPLASDYTAQIYLQCPYGKLDTLNSFGQVSINQRINCFQVVSAMEEQQQTYSYYPETCELSQFPNPEIFTDYFNLNCAGQKSCTLDFAQDWLPTSACTVSAARPENWQYIVTAVCASEHIQVFGGISKSNAALVVVVFDLAIVFIFWFSLIGLRPF